MNISANTTYKLSLLAQELGGGQVASALNWNVSSDEIGILYAIRIA